MSQTIITPTQCRTARRELSLSQGDVAAATGLNRVYISDFENGGTNRLTTGQQKKLVEFFKGKLEEAQDNGEELDLTFGQTEDPAAANLKESPALRSTAIACLHFAISPDIPAPDVLKIIRQMEENEARLEELLSKEAKEGGLLTFGQWDGETETDLQEAIATMAANFVLASLVQGKRFVYRETSEGEDAKTVRDVMNDTFATAFTGVIANWVNTRPANQPSQTADPESATEAPKAEEEKSWL